MYVKYLAQCFFFASSCFKPKAEVVKKEITPQDLSMGFDITLTKHKGQVSVYLFMENANLSADTFSTI